MKTTINIAGCSRPDLLTSIAESIRTVSTKARGTTIRPESRLLDELALDSLDLVAVVLQLQDQFQVELDPDAITQLQTVSDLAECLTKLLRRAA